MRPTNSPSDRVDRNKRNKKKKNLNIKNNNNDPVAGLFSSNFPIYWNETQSKNPTKTEPVAVRAGEGDVSLGHGRRRAPGAGRGAAGGEGKENVASGDGRDVAGAADSIQHLRS